MFGSQNQIKNFGQSEDVTERTLAAQKVGECMHNGKHIVVLKTYSEQQLIVVVIGPAPDSVKSNNSMMSHIQASAMPRDNYF